MFIQSEDREDDIILYKSQSPTLESNNRLYSKGLKQLYIKLEDKYNLDYINIILYILAINIKVGSPLASPSKGLQEDILLGEAIYLLVD